MPVDTLHRRYVPTGKRMAGVLARVLRAEWRRARKHVRDGLVPPFTGFFDRLYLALKPLLEWYYSRGHGDEMSRHRASKRPKKRVVAKSFHGAIEKRFRFPMFGAAEEFASQPVGSGGIFGGVVNAVKNAVMRIWNKIVGWVSRKIAESRMLTPSTPSTHSTPSTTSVIPTSVDRPTRTPDEIADGIKRGFDEKAAKNIAEEEAARIHHEGQIDAAKQTGKTTHKWLVNEGACPMCLKLAAVGSIPIGQAFGSTRNGGAIFNPPAHPHCRCTLGE